MANLKLYFLTFLDGKHIDTLVLREPPAIELKWNEFDEPNMCGIVHVGFVRPKIKIGLRYHDFAGKILVTASAKYALPEIYESSESPITNLALNKQIVPIYLIVRGFGYDLDPIEYKHLLQSNDTNTTGKETLNEENGHTIISAALKILEQKGKPLNKEEIFAYITEEKLFNFEARRPISVLGVELNRHTVGTNYTKASEQPVLAKTNEDKFYLLHSSLGLVMTGWLKSLPDMAPDLANNLMLYGIYNHASFVELQGSLPASFCDLTYLYKYKIQKLTVNLKDPHQLLLIVPNEVLEMRIENIGFTLRIENVLNEHDFEYLQELSEISEAEMLKWTNFGKKCVTDMCKQIIKISDRLIEDLNNLPSHSYVEPYDESSSVQQQNKLLKLDRINNKPLIEHFEDTLFNLPDNQRHILEQRTGSKVLIPVLTLQEIADKMSITRERVRQLQKKAVEKIIKEELWDDTIATKIGQLLASRTKPLYLEMLELEDPWFKGFIGNYKHLTAIIELFTENQIHTIKVHGANIITRPRQDDWDKIVSKTKELIKDKAAQNTWNRKDIEILISSLVSELGAPELAELLHGELMDLMQFNSDNDNALLIGFGKSAETAVATVLKQAEGPLHYSEIAKRATQILGKTVDERRAQSVLTTNRTKLYGRGTYGLAKFSPIDERMSKNIGLIVSKWINDGPLMRQWHSSGILSNLREQFPSLPEALDVYILNIILDNEKRITSLNRMVWARSDSHQTPNDRIDIADAYTKLLEDSGGPMKGSDLRESLREIRGVNDLQIQPNERMIQIGPDLWGLVDRDLGCQLDKAEELVECLYEYLEKTQKGIHLSEVDSLMLILNRKIYPEPYTLLNLAQRDKRFKLAHAMFLGLSAWEDVRRLNYTQAVKKILTEMQHPMSSAEISLQVEQLTGLNVDFQIAGLLINHGAIFEPISKKWTR